MDRFPLNEEARAEKLRQLIAKHTDATEASIFLGDKLTLAAIGVRLQDIEAGAEEADVLIRAAVVIGAGLVGPRIAAEVKFAIHQHVKPLAEADLVEAERARAESRDDNRVHAALADRVAV